DGHNYDVDTMVLAGEALRPFPCPSEPGEALRERQPLSASEVRTELPGNTLYADPGTYLGSLTRASTCLWRPTVCCTTRSTVGPPSARGTTLAGGTSCQTGTFAAEGGTTGVNNAP